MFTKPFSTNNAPIETEIFEYANESISAIETLGYDTATNNLISRHFTDYDQSIEMYFEPEYALWILTKGHTGKEEFEYTNISGSKLIEETWQNYINEIQALVKDQLPKELKEEGHKFSLTKN